MAKFIENISIYIATNNNNSNFLCKKIAIKKNILEHFNKNKFCSKCV